MADITRALRTQGRSKRHHKIMVMDGNAVEMQGAENLVAFSGGESGAEQPTDVSPNPAGGAALAPYQLHAGDEFGELKTNDWVKIDVVRSTEGRDKSFLQLGRVVDASSKCIRVATPLSVKESGDYRVTQADKWRKVTLFDEQRRAGNFATYARPIVDGIEEEANMRVAVGYFLYVHSREDMIIEDRDVRHAFKLTHEKFMAKAKRMDEAEASASAQSKRKRPRSS